MSRRLLESGDRGLLESGDIRLLEDGAAVSAGSAHWRRRQRLHGMFAGDEQQRPRRLPIPAAVAQSSHATVVPLADRHQPDRQHFEIESFRPRRRPVAPIDHAADPLTPIVPATRRRSWVPRIRATIWRRIRRMLPRGVDAGTDPVTIAVVNNGDGTATVTISGGESGDTNTVYSATAENLHGLVKRWTNRGSRTGPGSVTITTGRGAFFVFVISGVATSDIIRAVPTNQSDGTADVAVSGVGAGAAVTVRYAAVDDQWKPTPLSWTDGGSRTGPGTVTIATGAGAFFVYAEADDVDASPPEFVYVSDGVESVWNNVLDGARARLLVASLGVASARIKVLTQMDPDEVRRIADSTGGIIVAPGGAETYREGDNETDDLEYPVVIASVVAANRDADNRVLRETWMLIRERARRSLINQPLVTADASIFGCSLRTAPPIDQAAWRAMGLVSPLSLSFWSNESRGL